MQLNLNAIDFTDKLMYKNAEILQLLILQLLSVQTKTD